MPLTQKNTFLNAYPNEILISRQYSEGTGLNSASVILAHQTRTISKKRLPNPIGSIDDIVIQKMINDALRIHLNFNKIFLKFKTSCK